MKTDDNKKKPVATSVRTHQELLDYQQSVYKETGKKKTLDELIYELVKEKNERKGK